MDKFSPEIYDLSPFLNEKTLFYQKKDGFRFGTDTFLLADFIRVKGKEKVIDLGTGCGVIPILLLKKYPRLKAVGIDILEENVKLSLKNAEINRVGLRFRAVRANVKDIKSFFKPQSFDIAVSNPPFIETNRGSVSSKSHRAIARQEIAATLEDFIAAAQYLLRNKGKFYLLLPVHRFADSIELLRKYRLEPKRLRFIHPEEGKNANLFLLESVKSGGKGLEVEFPLIVYKDAKNKVYTKEVEKKYKEFLSEEQANER